MKIWFNAFRGFYDRTKPLNELDFISKWLYASRSIILVISFQAGVIASLISIIEHKFSIIPSIILTIGFIISHAISNLMNDYFGWKYGHDLVDSPRMKYTLHPIGSNIVSERELAKAIIILLVADILIAIYFFALRGIYALLLAISGFIILVSYDAFKRNLKNIGLGEIAVFFVWGPLMIGGGYYCITGEFSLKALIISIPYGLGVMSILVGKHIDQMEFDKNIHFNTLPVILGESFSRMLNIFIVLMMYIVIVVGLFLKIYSLPMIVVFLNFQKLFKFILVFSKPRPTQPPQGYIGWPLWYHRFSLIHNRSFGWLYILGLFISIYYSSLTQIINR